MERKMTQKELKEALAGSFERYGARVDKITFRTGIGADDKPEFNGADIVFEEGCANITAGKVYSYAPGELGVMLNRQFNEEGLTAIDTDNEDTVNVNFNMGVRMVSGTPIPVFKGITAQLQEYDRSSDMEDETDEPKYENPKMDSLADIRRQEQVESLKQLDSRDIMETVRAHFNSHPTLPGEKNLKMMVSDEPADDGVLSDEQREQLINGYAQTRIRETKMDMKGFSLNPTADLQMESLAQEGTVSLSRVNVELQKLTAGDKATVYVLAERADGRHMTIGKLPDKFLTNSPMNVESCRAELQVTDYSNGKLKNVSMRVVADTDLMSGDVLDLDDTILAGLDQDSGLEQCSAEMDYDAFMQMLHDSFCYEFDGTKFTFTRYPDDNNVTLDFGNMSEEMFEELAESDNISYDDAMCILRGSKCYAFEGSTLEVSDYHTGDAVRLGLYRMTEEMYGELLVDWDMDDEFEHAVNGMDDETGMEQ